jgi:hypothetical protein
MKAKTDAHQVDLLKLLGGVELNPGTHSTTGFLWAPSSIGRIAFWMLLIYLIMWTYTDAARRPVPTSQVDPGESTRTYLEMTGGLHRRKLQLHVCKTTASPTTN